VTSAQHNAELPASPVAVADADGSMTGTQYLISGFTKREELSARFMAALLTRPHVGRPDPASAAVVACEYADALLAEWAK